MTDMMLVSGARVGMSRLAGSEPDARLNTELRSWAILAAGSLAIAGIFAFLLAMSRVPGIETVIPWPLGFFSKGLVIHVVFSLVVWFLAIFALMASSATRDIAGLDIRFAGLGRIGLALVAMSFPMLFIPAFHSNTVATLNNYIPVIIHPGYYLGLVVLALGILMPVLRLFANAALNRHRVGALAFAMTMGGIVFCGALLSFGFGLAAVWGDEPSRLMHEHLFWGGGHLLQFLYCLLMLSGWHVLARLSLGDSAASPLILRIATALIGVCVLPAVAFYLIFDPYSAQQIEAFRRLQFGLALPSLLVAGNIAFNIVRLHRQGRSLPWHDPAFVAIALSALVFAVGGSMGFVINGIDTRTPAHYHGVIAGVNLTCMGLMLRYCLPALGRPVSPRARLRLQIALFGFGQLMASIGLFLAGGYGAPRKTPSGAAHLADGAAAGMFLHGIGALIAVIGGILFVVRVFRSLNGPQAPGVRGHVAAAA